MFSANSLFQTWSSEIEDLNRATFGKDSEDILSAIVDIQFKLPFPVLSFKTDNGTVFLYRALHMHFTEISPSEFTRSRPYKKNVNCHVEQKNWTHVRETLGYERYDQEEHVRMMNILYKLYLNKLQNFFVPQLKLIEKVRVGSKIIKKYDKPKTPYQRFLESAHLTMGQKENLRREFQLLNPIELREVIKRHSVKLRRFKVELELEEKKLVA